MNAEKKIEKAETAVAEAREHLARVRGAQGYGRWLATKARFVRGTKKSLVEWLERQVAHDEEDLKRAERRLKRAEKRLAEARDGAR